MIHQRFFTAICLSFLFVAFLSFPVHAIEKPSAKRRQEIKQKIERVKTYLKQYNECKKKEMKARAAKDKVEAQIWKDRADSYEAKMQSEGDSLVQQVDQDYDIPEPPGTTIVFDPDSRDYAYVPKTTDKSNIKVVICPQVLSDGPGLVASTKIHELKHAAQVASCMSSNPRFWKYCSFWNHSAEWQAYTEEEKYYDKKITDDMPKKEKDLIKKRAENERKAAITKGLKKTKWFSANAHKRAGEVVATQALIYNASSAPQTIEAQISDDLGWTIVPSIITLPLDAEEGILESITIDVPPGASVGEVNSVYLSLSPPSVDDVSDIMFIIVDPSVEITAGESIDGLRGEAPPVEFWVENISSASDTFDIEITNPLGWNVVPNSWPNVLLNPGESIPVAANVEIPPDAPDWTVNAIVCSATSTTDSSQAAEAWTPLRVNEEDIAALTILSPTPVIDADASIVPEAWVMNAGHIDSFFDVFFEIEDDLGGPVFNDSIPIAGLPPGATQQILFNPVSLMTPGEYTARISISLPQDADISNDIQSASFEVTGSNVIKWKQY